MLHKFIPKAARILFVLPLLATALPGYAMGASPVRYAKKNAALRHRGPWPIYRWHDLQPTEKQLRAMHIRDITRREARRVGELYWELQSMQPNGGENCNSFAIQGSERARCRASLARRAYVIPSRPVPSIESR
jgi:hypothetical protein